MNTEGEKKLNNFGSWTKLMNLELFKYQYFCDTNGKN